MRSDIGGPDIDNWRILVDFESKTPSAAVGETFITSQLLHNVPGCCTVNATFAGNQNTTLRNTQAAAIFKVGGYSQFSSTFPPVATTYSSSYIHTAIRSVYECEQELTSCEERRL